MRQMRRIVLLGLGIGLLSSTSFAQNAPTLEALPTGQYYYLRSSTPPQTQAGYLLLRKSGRTVIGIDGRIPAQPVCFRGFIANNQINHATRVYPPYQPDSRLEVDRGTMVALDRFETTERSPDSQQLDSLRSCVQFFWR